MPLQPPALQSIAGRGAAGALSAAGQPLIAEQQPRRSGGPRRRGDTSRGRGATRGGEASAVWLEWRRVALSTRWGMRTESAARAALSCCRGPERTTRHKAHREALREMGGQTRSYRGTAHSQGAVPMAPMRPRSKRPEESKRSEGPRGPRQGPSSKSARLLGGCCRSATDVPGAR